MTLNQKLLSRRDCKQSCTKLLDTFFSADSISTHETNPGCSQFAGQQIPQATNYMAGFFQTPPSNCHHHSRSITQNLHRWTHQWGLKSEKTVCKLMLLIYKFKVYPPCLIIFSYNLIFCCLHFFSMLRFCCVVFCLLFLIFDNFQHYCYYFLQFLVILLFT